MTIQRFLLTQWRRRCVFDVFWKGQGGDWKIQRADLSDWITSSAIHTPSRFRWTTSQCTWLIACPSSEILSYLASRHNFEQSWCGPFGCFAGSSWVTGQRDLRIIEDQTWKGGLKDNRASHWSSICSSTRIKDGGFGMAIGSVPQRKHQVIQKFDMSEEWW